MESKWDFECPICLMLMIEPILLPCKHELCRKCFELHCTQTSDQCPFCRVHINSSARKATRTNQLINVQKWEKIKKLFPGKVAQILEGNDVISDEEEIVPQIISEVGSLGKEYMEELKKLEDERERARQEEEAASLALITKLCQEEEELASKARSLLNASNAVSSAIPAARVYAVADMNRLKEIEEEEAASRLLITQLQQEENVWWLQDRTNTDSDDKSSGSAVPHNALVMPDLSNSSSSGNISASLTVASATSLTVASATSLQLPSSQESLGSSPTSSKTSVRQTFTSKIKKPTAAVTPLTKWLKNVNFADTSLGSDIQPSTSTLSSDNPTTVNPTFRPISVDTTGSSSMTSTVIEGGHQNPTISSLSVQSYSTSSAAVEGSNQAVIEVIQDEVVQLTDATPLAGITGNLNPGISVIAQQTYLNPGISVIAQQTHEAAANNTVENKSRVTQPMKPLEEVIDLVSPVSSGSGKNAGKLNKSKKTMSSLTPAEESLLIGDTSQLLECLLPGRRGRGRQTKPSSRRAPKRSQVDIDLPLSNNEVLPNLDGDSICLPAEKKLHLNHPEVRGKKFNSQLEDVAHLAKTAFPTIQDSQAYMEERDRLMASKLQRVFDKEAANSAPLKRKAAPPTDNNRYNLRRGRLPTVDGDKTE